MNVIIKSLRVIFPLFFFICSTLHAQHRTSSGRTSASCPTSNKKANFWYFGINAGINFNSGAAVAVTNGQLNTREGVSTMSDDNGNLLFYTDGISVWNKNHTVMGTGLNGNPSSTQSGVIIPNPANVSKYYIFTADIINGSLGYCYSEIDMTLNAGLGGIVASTKNTLLYQNHTEKITATKHANGTDFWVILHENNNSNFRAYQISSSGISTPVISTAGSSIGFAVPGSNSIGYLKFNKGGDLLIDVYNGLNYSAEIFNFDTSTGVITGPSITLSPLSACYGAEFSDNGKYVYIAELQRSSSFDPGYNNTGAISQYNIKAGNNAAINASRVELITSATIGYGALQMAPDGKIYAAKENGYYNGMNYLGVINSPDAAGTLSNYVENGFYLGGRQTLIGLPNFISSDYSSTPIKLSGKPTICLNDTAVYTVRPSDGLTFQWTTTNTSVVASTDSSQTIKFTTAGAIKIKVQTTGCPLVSKDSITVNVTSSPPFDIDMANVLTCPNTSVTLDAGSGYDSYLWQDGSTLSTYTTQQAGDYHVKVTLACAKAEDTASIAFYAGVDPEILNLQPSYCISAVDVPLTATPSGGVFSGSIVTGATIHLGNLNTGTYTINYTYQDANNCLRRDSKQVTITDDCFFIPNLITPNNDGPNDAFHVIGIGNDYTLEVYNRWGDLIYKKENYDNSFNGDGVNDGVYFFALTHPEKDKKYKGWLHILGKK